MKSIKIIPVMICLLSMSCEYTDLEAPFDCSEVEIEIGLVGEVQNAECDIPNGSFEVTALGGAGAYSYSLDGVEKSSGKFGELSAGVYNVVAEDANGCTGMLSVEILNSDGVNITVTIDEAGCGTQQGGITIEASGGEQPYTYLLNNEPGGNNEFKDLGAGTYEIKVVDNAGCETTRTVSVLTGITYSSSVAGIIQTNCAISGCHAGSISPDLRTLTNIQQSASRIKARTSAKTMPPSGALPQEQIDAIACWVDDGALDN